MLNKATLNNIIRKLIIVVVSLIILLLLAYGVATSSFNDIKKYDEEDNSKRLHMPMSKQKEKMAKEKYYTTKVKVSNSENMANLGDFELNIAGGKKLVANISLSFKNHKEDSWLYSKDVKEEIVKKGVVLRSSVINTLSHYKNIDINNKRMKVQLIEDMNTYLSEGEVKEVYFNEYITH